MSVKRTSLGDERGSGIARQEKYKAEETVLGSQQVKMGRN